MMAPSVSWADNVTWIGGSGVWDTTSLNWNGGLSTWNNANSDGAIFSATGTNTITMFENITARSLTFSSGSYTINGGGVFTLTLVPTGTSTAGPATINAVSGSTINASLVGTSGLTKTGTGNLTLGADNAALTGAVTVAGQYFTSGGPALTLNSLGTLTGATSYNVGLNATLAVINGTDAALTNLTNRLADTATITLTGGRLNYTGGGGGTVNTETFGDLVVNGFGALRAFTGTGQTSTTLTFGNLTRSDAFSALYVNGPIGGPAGPSNVTVTFANGAALASQAISDPLGPVGGQNTGVIPWMASNASNFASSDVRGLVTYDSDGLRVMNFNNATYFAQLAAGDISAAANLNVNLTGTAYTVNANTQVNSLVVNSGTTTFTGPGTLTINSGALVTFWGTTFNGPTLDFGSNTGYVHLSFPLNINGASQITGTGGLVVSSIGASTSYRVTFSNAANSFSGGLYINGNANVAFTSNAQLGAAGEGISLRGGTLTFTGAGSESLTGRTLTIGDAGGRVQIDSATANLTVASLAGTGELVKLGAGTITFTGAGTGGSLAIDAGQARFTDAGSATSLSQATITGTTSVLVLDNSVTNLANRIADTAAINLAGGTLRYIGNAAGSSETLGQLTVISGTTNRVEIINNGGATTLTFAGLTDLAAGTGLVVAGDNLGAASGDFSRVLFTTAPTLVGGVIPNVLYNNGGPNTAATYDAVLGVITAAVSVTGNVINNAAPQNVPTTANFVTSQTGVEPTPSVVAGGATLASLTLDAGSGLVFQGAGTLTISDGLLASQAGNKTVSGPFGSVIDFGAVNGVVSTAGNLTLTSDITLTGSGGLTKQGAGTLTIQGGYAVAGGLTVNAGTLNFDNAGPITLNTLGGTTNGTLQLDSGSTLILTGGTQTVASNITGTGGLTYAPTTTFVTLTLSGNNTFSGGLTVTSSTGEAIVSFDTPSRLGSGPITLTGGTGQAVLSYTGTGAQTLTNDIVMDGFGSSRGLRVTQASGQLIVSGLISGTSAIETRGSGVLGPDGTILFTNTANTYTGETRLYSGTLQISDPGQLGNTSNVDLFGGVLRTTATMTLGMPFEVTFGSGSAISPDAGTVLTLDGTLTGTSGFAKQGQGTLVLTNAFNTFSATLNLQSGRLAVNGNLPFAAGDSLTVSAGAALGGSGDGLTTGVIDRNVIVSAGGIIAPGTLDGDTGILTFNRNLNASGAIFEFDLNGATPGTGHDQIVLGPSSTLLNINGAVLTGQTNFIPTGSTVLTLLDNQSFGFVSGNFIDSQFNTLFEGSSVTLGDWIWTISYTGGANFNSITLLNPTPIPEPGTLALLGLATLGASLTVRRRLRR